MRSCTDGRTCSTTTAAPHHPSQHLSPIPPRPTPLTASIHSLESTISAATHRRRSGLASCASSAPARNPARVAVPALPHDVACLVVENMLLHLPLTSLHCLAHAPAHIHTCTCALSSDPCASPCNRPSTPQHMPPPLPAVPARDLTNGTHLAFAAAPLRISKGEVQHGSCRCAHGATRLRERRFSSAAVQA